jgi:hypothetical protein
MARSVQGTLAAFGAALALTGCAARGAHVEELPGWYRAGAAPYSADEYVIGRGACGAETAAGERAQCARQRATEDALLQIRAHVTAVRERRCRVESSEHQVEGEQARTAEATCSSEFDGRSEASLDLAHITPREEGCGAEQCFALLALSRSELVARIRAGTAAQAQELQQLLVQAHSQDLLSSLSALSRALELAGTLDESEALVSAVAGLGAATRTPSAEVIATRAARLTNVSACLVAESDAARVFARTSEWLAQQGVSSVRVGECDASSLRIEFTPSTGSEPDARPAQGISDMWTVRYLGTVRVSTGDAQLARERAVEGRGVSRSVDSARADARDRLSAAVRAAIAELVMGQQV